MQVWKIVLPLHPLSETQYEIFVQASGKVYFHATSTAENAEFRRNAEIAQLVEHNLAARIIRFTTLARIYNTKKQICRNAEIAQLVEHNLAKVGVASSSLVFRS